MNWGLHIVASRPPTVACSCFVIFLRQSLNKCKVNMKRDLENSITNYNDSVLAVYQV